MALANGRCVFLAVIDSETGLKLHHGAALRERAQGRCRCLGLASHTVLRVIKSPAPLCLKIFRNKKQNVQSHTLQETSGSHIFAA